MNVFEIIVALFFSLGVNGFTSGTFKAASQGPAVAAVVPVWEPDFQYLINFMQQWAQCPEGRAAMDVYVVFSTKSSKDKFASRYGRQGPWTSLVQSADPGVTSLKNAASWKKLDGLAQLFTAGHAYRFVLMIDSELAINSCSGFSQFTQSLQQRFDSKVWYASRTHGPSPLIKNAVCAVVDCTEAGADSKLQEATKGLTLYTWWNDMPWVEVESGKRMFGIWAQRLRKKAAAEGHAALVQRMTANIQKLDYVDTLHAAVQHGVLKTIAPGFDGDASAELLSIPYDESDVAGQLGTGPEAAPVAVAGYAYEHLIYQYHMVENEGFRIRDLADDGLSVWCKQCSMLECLHLPGHTHEVETYMRVVNPLWVPRRGPDAVPLTEYAPPSGTAVLVFHMDRTKNGCH